MIKQSSKLVLCIGVIVVILAGLFRFTILDNQNNTKIDTASTLTDAIDISDLSTAEFKYRGIAEIYTNDEKTKVRCRVCYDAIVKAGIDVNEVKFDVDKVEKTVKPSLPEIDLKVTIVDEKSMAVLPSNTTVGFDIMLKYT